MILTPNPSKSETSRVTRARSLVKAVAAMSPSATFRGLPFTLHCPDKTPPSFRDRLIDWKDSLSEPGPQCAFEPFLQLSPALALGRMVIPFRISPSEITLRNSRSSCALSQPIGNALLRTGPCQFRGNICVEEKSPHRARSRPWSPSRSKSRSKPLNGDSANN